MLAISCDSQAVVLKTNLIPPGLFPLLSASVCSSWWGGTQEHSPTRSGPSLFWSRPQVVLFSLTVTARTGQLDPFITINPELSGV